MNSEFDTLADTFFRLTQVQNPDVTGTVEELKKISNLQSEVEIRKIVEEVVSTPDKNNHKIIQSIKKQQDAGNEKNFNAAL